MCGSVIFAAAVLVASNWEEPSNVSAARRHSVQAAPRGRAKQGGSARPLKTWGTSGDVIHAQLDLLELTNGEIPIPSAITHVIIEIGVNNPSASLWNDSLPMEIPGVPRGAKIKDLSHVLLVSFEPLLDKWAALVRSGDDMKSRSPGWSDEGRRIALPFAVGESDGSATFNVARLDGCSSMLPIDAHQLRGVWKNRKHYFMTTKCSKQVGRPRTVPVVSLDTVIGTWLAGRNISLVKIDAQGYDVSVAKSGKNVTSSIGVVMLEITANQCHLGYVGADTCDTAVRTMQDLGFDTAARCNDKWRFRNLGCESDFIFSRKGEAKVDGWADGRPDALYSSADG